MAKPSKRAQILLSGSLGEKLAEAEEDEPQSVLTPVKDRNAVFYEAIAEAEKESGLSSDKQKSSSNIGATLFVTFIIIAFIAICVGGYLFAKSNDLI